jgi:hypothetical protein
MRGWLAQGQAVGQAVALAMALGLTGCKGSHGESTAPDAAPLDAGPADAGPVDGGPDGHPSATPTSGLDAGAPPDDSIPSTSSDELTGRARHLLEAVGKDDPDLASDILFPRDGWMATRDADDPGKEWEKRVAAPFRKAVHAGARHHEIDRAQLVSLELGHAMVQSTPKRHGWKKPLWVVHGSRLTYVVDGHTRTLNIHEMTAWRGAWYVTRLR